MEKNFNHEESLSLINEMIHRAQNNVQKKRQFSMIFWGYTIAVVAVLNYVLLHTLGNPVQSFWVWCLTFPAWIISYFIHRHVNQSVKVKTYIDKLGHLIWNGYLFGVIVLLIIIFAAAIKHQLPAMFILITPVIMILIGISEFTTACIYRYKVWFWIAALFGVGAIVAVFLPNDLQFIILAVCMVLGFVVPGYILNHQLKKTHA